MIKQPLFGQDSSPHITSMILSSIITLIAWIIFCLMTFLIKFKPKTPQYKEIQIVLSSTPIEERNEEQSSAETAALPENTAAVPEPVEGPLVEAIETPEIPNPVEKPVAEAKVEAPKQTPAPAKPQTQTTPKTQTQPAKTTTKTETPADKRVPDYQQYGKTMEELIEEQFNKNTRTQQDIDNIFEQMDSDVTETQISQPVKTVTTPSSVSGSAADAAPKTNASKSSRDNQQQTANNAPSDLTKNMLKNIASSKPYFESTGNIDSAVMITTAKDSDGHENVRMSDGTMRALLRPETPNIKLSEKAAAEIKTNIKLSIEITVLKDGPILLSKINITPAAAVNDIVKEDIIEKLSQWLFEPAPDGSTATATFTLTINKQ